MRSRTATLLLAVLVLSLCASVVQAKKNRTRSGIATRSHIYQFNSYRTDYVAKSGANVILATETYAIKAVFKGVFTIRFVRTDGNAAKSVKARMNCLAADGTSVLDVETPSADRTDIFYNHGGTVSGYAGCCAASENCGVRASDASPVWTRPVWDPWPDPSLPRR